MKCSSCSRQHIPWQVAEVAEACVQPAHWSADVDTLAEMVVKTAHPGDHILVMSNGGFRRHSSEAAG
ncbi:UDP-N-acetylmuramate:L-alanyl-gamma-D-glutamyl-meso-diaminopimelate ligase [Klebsiella pneumoniae subsp. rhinoscleromatis]|nr:UDP-N-acetylmuramate:L-alanyl-gamma-D-glutamyl-meso-diaminopimelate ligase [Klebsiella pneumoniae subsp. rhinoscleromatis]